MSQQGAPASSLVPRIWGAFVACHGLVVAATAAMRAVGGRRLSR